MATFRKRMRASMITPRGSGLDTAPAIRSYALLAIAMASATPRAELLLRHAQRLQLMVPAEPQDLRGLPLFAGIPEKARDKVIEKVRRHVHKVGLRKGEIVLREGDYSDSAFYVVEGSVEVELPSLAARPGALAR